MSTNTAIKIPENLPQEVSTAWLKNLELAKKREVPKDVQKNIETYYKNFDQKYTEALIEHVISPMSDYYYRPVFVGFDEQEERNNPERPLIYYSNHSGMAFPWDGMIFLAEIFRQFGFQKKSIRPLVAPMLSQSALMNPFGAYNLWKKVGGIDATTLNFETMMNCNDYNIMVYPEGVPGIGKGFNRKYEAQRFSTSFIRMALKYKTDIIPFATVNGEYINPHTYSIPWVNKLVNKIGIPFLPMGIITALVPIFPWLFYTGFPAKMTYVKGERINPSELLDKPSEEATQEDVVRIRDYVRDEFQKLLDESVEKYGQKPFNWKDLRAANKGKEKRGSKIRFFPYLTPIGWPMLFSEFDRKYRKYEQEGRKGKFTLRMRRRDFFPLLFRNLITISYFIPVLGWIPLAIRGYSKPKGEK
ncbi:hypothetical protein V9L05_21455 [Bernardetia sp. Wsw4-3y2]|uniref:hypothetical protein n=1 Tax=Bernardetia sp. Wsw4-3y2 TaxID=3127471 RepID=UPI0030D5C331